MTTLRSLAARLPIYEEQEARSIVRLLLYDVFGLSYTDICCGALDRMDEAEREKLETCMQRLEKGEPVQYVTGQALFAGRTFHVEPGCLIPRPETEELCRWIADEVHTEAPRILDIGTGSGCIAITLSKEVEGSHVSAWDISERALGIARGNAERLEAEVDLCLQDALCAPLDDLDRWDVIVSNPPYICEEEKEDMEANVLDYEPHTALFVPNESPLLFYDAIARYGLRSLRPGGALYFEINRRYGQETVDMLVSLGYHDVELRNDEFGNARMVRAVRNEQ